MTLKFGKIKIKINFSQNSARLVRLFLFVLIISPIIWFLTLSLLGTEVGTLEKFLQDKAIAVIREDPEEPDEYSRLDHKQIGKERMFKQEKHDFRAQEDPVFEFDAAISISSGQPGGPIVKRVKETPPEENLEKPELSSGFLNKIKNTIVDLIPKLSIFSGKPKAEEQELIDHPDQPESELTPVENPNPVEPAQSNEDSSPSNTDPQVPQQEDPEPTSNKNLYEKLANSLSSPTVLAADSQIISAEVLDQSGQLMVEIVPTLERTPEGKNKIRIPKPERTFQPGRYMLEVRILEGDTITVANQDFTWGVLAINPNKSIYSPSEKSNLAMAVLDDHGEMVCDAKLTLEITNPDTGITETLSTENEKIKVNPECKLKDFTLKPDYEAEYKVGKTGSYMMKLIAETEDGRREISDGFSVEQRVPFDVERITATRIYPAKDYPVTLKIIANQDFQGEIQEEVPMVFTVNKGDRGDWQNFDKVDYNGKTKVLTWEVSLRKGQRIDLGYIYDAPDVSPYFYLLGPLRFKENGNTVFEEKREWQVASDSVTGTYTSFWGSTGAAGTTRFATLNGVTEGALLAGDASSASNIDFIKGIHAPTRDEDLVGHIKEDGRLDILKCTGSCDAATDDALQFNKTIDATQACDATFGSCWRQFDIAYEQLSGDAMTAFVDPASDGTIKYCTYNGSAWNPTGCTTPSSYTFNSGSAVDGKWVRLVARGEGMKTGRTDEILLIIGDANNDIFAARWDGSNWGNLTTITQTASTYQIQNFDGAWEETTGNALVVWAEGTTATTTPFRYKRWIRGTTTWDASGTSMTTTGTHIGHWVTMKSAPIAGKDHIAIMTQTATTMGNNCVTGTNCAAQPWIWTGGASPTMTKGNEWASTEPTAQRSSDVAIESVNIGSVQALYVGSTQTTLAGDSYETWVEGTGFSSVTAIGGTTANTGDDPVGWQITGHPNSNEVQITVEDCDADANHTNWSGTAMNAAGWDQAALSAAGEAALAPVSHTVENSEGTAFWVSATPYSAWSKNWRWWRASTDLNTTPNTANALANENVTPQVGNTSGHDYRLRVNVAELAAGPNEIDSRKKLQYVSASTCANPDSCPNASWADVDNVSGAGIWRYSADADVACTPTDCDDNTLLAGAVLTSTNATCTAGNGCGTWIASKDAAAGANMDHNSTIVQELEYVVENNGAASSTVYYFRLFDVGDNTNLFRQQNASVCGPSQNATCTYPSIDTSSVDAIVSTSGTQDTPLFIPSIDNYVGGKFAITDTTGSRNVTGITISEQGTVDAQADLDNIELYYNSDTSAPYDCASKSYVDGDLAQFGTTDTDGFSGINGTSAFTGSVGISTTSAMCVYVVLDVGSGASDTETMEIEITNPSANVVVSSGVVGPSSAVAISGTTTLNTPFVTGTLGKTTDSWSGAVPVYMTLSGLIQGSYPYARAQVTTIASQTFYADMTWDSGDNRYEGTIYIGSNICMGCDDPKTYSGSFSVTVQLDNNAGFPSVDYSDSAGTFTSTIALKRTSLDNVTNTNYTDFNAVWSTNHWNISISDLGVAMLAGSGSNIAVAIPIHPTSSTPSNFTVAFNGSGISQGSAQSTTNAWWYDSDSHTLYLQFASLTTTLVDVDITFDSDTDLFATRYNWTYTADMGSRRFSNGLYIANHYLTTFYYGKPVSLTDNNVACSGNECEGTGMQAESRAHEDGGPDESTDCMERVAVHVDDTAVSDATTYYQYDIKWKQTETPTWITEEDNNHFTMVTNSDDTASTGWAQQLNNGISAERTQVYYANKRYIKNEYAFTNNDSVSHKYPMIWEREQWHGTDRQVNDHGRFYGDTVDQVMEQRVSMSGYTCPWQTAYDSGTYINMGVVYDRNDLPDYGIFAVEPFLAPTAYEWPIGITSSHATQTTDQTGFEKTWTTVNASQTVNFSFWHVHNAESSWSAIDSAMNADCNELNPSSGVTVSGHAYTDEAKTTPITDGRTVHLFVNSTDYSTTTTATGSYTFNNVTVTAGDSVIVYLDGVAEDGSAVTLALDDTTAISNLDIITAHVSLEHRATGPITNTDLDDIDAVDAGDEDGITISGGNATFASGLELSVVSGETYTPGGTVACDDFEVEGTGVFSPGTNAVSISGDWEMSSSGTLTTSGTVTLSGTLAQTVITGGKTFSGLTLNNTGSDGTDDNITVSGALDINGTLTITNGDLDLNTNNPNVNTAGDVSIGSSAFVTKGSGTWTFDGGSQTFTDSTSGQQDIGAVTIGPSTTTSLSTSSAMKVTTMTTGGDDTLNITDDTLTIMGSGTPFTEGGTFTVTSSNVIYAGSSATNITTTQYNNLTVTPSSGTPTYSLTGHLTGSNALLGGITISVNAVLETTAANNYNITLPGNWTNSGGFTPNSGTVDFSGSGTQQVNAGGAAAGKSFNALTHSGSGTLQLVTSGIDVNGAFQNTNGNFNCNSQNQNFAGNFSISGGSWTKGGTMTFDGGSQTFSDSTTGDMGVVTIGPSTTTTLATSTAMNATSITVGANDTFNITDDTVTILGSGTGASRPFIETTGTFTVTNSTFRFFGTADTTVQETTYNNLFLAPNGGSTPIYTLTTTASQTITSQNLTIGNGTNAVSVTAGTNNPILDVNGDFYMYSSASFAGGTQTMTVGTDTTLDGDFTLASGATWTAGSGTLILDGGDDTNLIYFNDQNGTKQNVGNIQIGASPATINLSSDMAANSLTVSTGDKLNTRGYDLDIATYITVNGTLNCTDSVENDGTTVSLGTNWTVASGGTFTAQESDTNPTTVIFDESSSGSLSPGGTDENHDFYNIQISKGASATITMQAAIDIESNLSIANSNSVLSTGTNYAINIGGNWSNVGTFTPGTGTVTFDSGDTGETIDAGGTGTGKPFYNVVFNNSTGGWTIQTSDMKVSHDLTITDVSSWALAASRTLEVDGTYSIVDAETGATTWNTGSVFYLNGTSQTIGSKIQTAETYATLQIGANTDIRTWLSSATTYTVDGTGSLYSQDHANVNGDLYIWGDYHANTNDYWSYATDFDGISLSGGSERQVDIRVDPAATVTVDSGDTLASIGTAANRTTVSRQGASGGYGITTASGGTINFQYTNFDYLDGSSGLNIQTGATVTSLDYTDFDNLVGSAATNDAYITLASSVIGSATKTLTGVNFDRTDTSVEFNVNRTGTDDTGNWDFDASTGTYDGESYDGDDGVNEADPGMLRWDDSTLNQPPSTPSTLGPAGYIDAVGWMNDNTPTFNFTLSDPDSGQQVKYQIQIDDTAGFGSPVVDYTSALSSQGVFNFTVGQVAGGGTYTTGNGGQTLSDSTAGGGYYWRVKAIDAAAAESSYEEAGTDSTIDFRVDATAPTGGTVYDGSSGDQDWNDGSLTQLEGNWLSFDSTTSGLQRYEYAVRRQADSFYWSVCSGAGTWQVAENWCDNGTGTSINRSNMNLQTGVTYYVSVRALDNANNTGTPVNSNGQQVLPTFTFSLNANSITFDNLNDTNDWTDSKTSVTTASTNASTGYTVKISESQLMTSIPYPSQTISDFAGVWANPLTWGLGTYGFGYTSNDTSVQGSNRFNNGTEYAAVSQTAPGDVAADHTDAVNGSTGAVSNEQFTITYKVAVPSSQTASEYRTYILYIATANF